MLLDTAAAAAILDTAVRAGVHSLRLSQDASADLDERSKADGSPVTRADTESQQIIVDGLLRLFPDTPIVGEEGEHAPEAQRAAYTDYFVIDPIDGTEGFLEGSGEFAVCIGFVRDGIVRFGLVCSPALDEAVMGEPGVGLCIVRAASSRSQDDELTVLPRGGSAAGDEAWGTPLRDRAVSVIASRHNMDAATGGWIAALGARAGGVSLVQTGSARKFMSIARNEAHVYPRFSPCSQWDIAAGHAIVEAGGGMVFDADTGAVPRYRADQLRAPRFVAWSRDGLAMAASMHSLIDSA